MHKALFSGESEEWGTPKKIVFDVQEIVKQCRGREDCDGCPYWEPIRAETPEEDDHMCSIGYPALTEMYGERFIDMMCNPTGQKEKWLKILEEKEKENDQV